MAKISHSYNAAVIFVTCYISLQACADNLKCKRVRSIYGTMLRGHVFQEHNRCSYTRPLAHGEPWGYGLGWVYPGLCSTPRLRLHACKLPKGKVSVDLFWRETYLHVNMEDLNDGLFFGLISLIVTALLLNRPPQLSSAIQRFILRRQRRRRLQSPFLQSLQLSHLYFRRRLAAAQTDIRFCTEQR